MAPQPFRRAALEDAFFQKQNQGLLAQLQERMAKLDRKAQLAEASGITDDALLDRLVDLQIRPETLTALSLVPLVEVAWAGGKMHPKQRDAVLSAAEQTGLDHHYDSYALLQEWLAVKPDPELMVAWKAYVRCLCQRIGAEATRTLKDDLLDRALLIAEAAGGILGFYRVSREERAKLDELAATLDELSAAFPSCDRPPGAEEIPEDQTD
jgi:hypothetical protein